MRRALLLTGMAAGAIAIFTALTVSSSAERKLEAHWSKVKDIAFCQKGYEIASSFPSYASHSAQSTVEAMNLMMLSNDLQEQSDQLEELLESDMAREAGDLGLSERDYQFKLELIRAEAEIKAVMAFQQAEDPSEVLDYLDDVCDRHLS